MWSPTDYLGVAVDGDARSLLLGPLDHSVLPGRRNNCLALQRWEDSALGRPRLDAASIALRAAVRPTDAIRRDGEALVHGNCLGRRWRREHSEST
jgi:hypothetical protein